MTEFLHKQEIQKVINLYSNYLERHFTNSLHFKLTENSDTSPFARCFWIFGMHLIRKNSFFDSIKHELAKSIITDLHLLKKRNSYDFKFTKHYQQLLCFSLSALSILKLIDVYPLEEFVIDQIPLNINDTLNSYGCNYGKPQSGNHAMFIAIFLLHSQKYLNISCTKNINLWVDYHLSTMNKNGFWGNKDNITYLQFQNGYHQYEIFEYLNINHNQTFNTLKTLADNYGHFAPYPGGGGCYDYDAIFLLTQHFKKNNKLLMKSLFSLLSIQNPDGGFSESHKIRPRSLINIINHIKFCFSNFKNTDMALEKFRLLITLQFPKNNTINTHWTNYSREWSESNLWDSWFRMLSIARIDMCASQSFDWGFINYPGIGFHHSITNEK